MNDEKLSRLNMLIGEEKVDILKKSKVAVFGIGGVGGYVVEGLIRSFVGNLILVDNDKVDLSNFNRQIIATNHSIGQDKVDAIKERVLSINENVNITTYKTFVLSENIDKIDLNGVDYVVDAIDTITGKIGIIKYCKEHNIKVISAMGCGNKLRAELLKIENLKNTKNCRLAKVMRHELKKYGIEDLKVVYSEEDTKIKMNPPASSIFVPAVAGLLIAETIVFDLIY